MSILVISVQNDYTTNKVLQWFQHYQIPFKRINIDSSRDVIYELSELNFNEFSGYWYRRGKFVNPPINNLYNIEIQQYLEENNRKILEFFEYKMMKKKNLNSFFNSDLNKLIILEMAKEVGLLTPDFQLVKIHKPIDNFEYIYKTINGDGNIFDYKNNIIFNVLTQEYIEDVDYEFSPTLFQRKIEKKYEIRAFYMNENFYSMVILSQKRQETRIDYRAIGEQDKSRMVPYLLPVSVKQKLKKLMINIGINSGVIDLIVTPSNKYFFLEVNPIGHFGMISYCCNYGIEEKIAKFYKND
ncbi:grasp-with-spasm system ATP-grasp peptide maturase [Chryseobacterium sp. CCH4-E10]|jgi:ATP-GRASP peptide maturase of grasp-with-spasm system|uniref:grasp-with-spasm system ATP-grasp peptide maturase n=1 Tax=Chryseobacterium sp. CCH4-E10 TaxID=1768758 RepID=UPI000835AC54|nr:grasp-with-spasm system ATP-grasp peptide maturase [Chryseobacterium sp. CCH4-E10]